MAAILLRKNRWNLPRKESLKVFRGLRHTANVAIAGGNSNWDQPSNGGWSNWKPQRHRCKKPSVRKTQRVSFLLCFMNRGQRIPARPALGFAMGRLDSTAGFHQPGYIVLVPRTLFKDSDSLRGFTPHPTNFLKKVGSKTFKPVVSSFLPRLPASS